MGERAAVNMKEQAKRRSTGGMSERRQSAFSAQDSMNGVEDGEPHGDDNDDNDSDGNAEG